ncbi:MAG TPA: hypothetical protein VM869_06395, partial [Enhygromyxa sp.]|nr:hypothetical protein [Enhygromyxa sp.]
GLAGLPAATEVYVFSNPKVSTCAVLDLITGLQPLEHSFMAGNDDAMCQPVDPCAPMDAHAEGPCEAVLGPFWFGQSCGHSSGCTCSGKDCVVVDVWEYAEWWQRPMVCEAAFAACI